MEAIYFGNITVWGYGAGNGPWIMADLENGLFSGADAGFNPTTRPPTTATSPPWSKGGPNQWAIQGGNAQSGGLPPTTTGCARARATTR